jgi:hypothetical protein
VGNNASSALYNQRAIAPAEVEVWAGRHHFNLLHEHRGDQEWLRCQVDPRDLRDMHGVIGRDGFDVALEKGRHFRVLLERFRDRIERGDFPAADDIRRHGPDKPAIIVERTRSNGAMYVTDGEARTFNALFHDEPLLDALVVMSDIEREVL